MATRTPPAVNLTGAERRQIERALVAAFEVLDSVAFVTQPGDTQSPIFHIAAALRAISAAKARAEPAAGEHCRAVQARIDADTAEAAQAYCERAQRAAAGLHAIADAIATMEPDDEPNTAEACRARADAFRDANPGAFPYGPFADR